MDTPFSQIPDQEFVTHLLIGHPRQVAADSARLIFTTFILSDETHVQKVVTDRFNFMVSFELISANLILCRGADLSNSASRFSTCGPVRRLNKGSLQKTLIELWIC